MSQVTGTERKTNKSKGISFSEMIKICLGHWKWYAVSIIIIMGYTLYDLFTTEATYMRTASILIKEESKGGQFGNMAAALGEIGGITPMSSVDNELVAIQSPAVMLEVIGKLGLNTDYTDISKLRPKTLYGSNQPFILTFPNDKSASIELKGVFEVDKKFVINKIKHKKNKVTQKISGKYILDLNKGVDSVATPVGTIYIAPNPKCNLAKMEEPIKIKVYHTPVEWRVQSIGGELVAVLANRKASVIDLSFPDHSKERANDVINSVIEVYNSRWIDDKNRMTEATADFIGERIDIIKAELLNVDREISDYKSKNALPDLQAIVAVDLSKQTETERKILELQSQYTMAKQLQEFISNEENNDKVLPSLSITGLSTSISVNEEIVEYNSILMERNRLASVNSVNNPLVKDFDRRLDGMRKAIIQSVSTQVQQLRTALNDMLEERNRTIGRIANSPSQANDLLGVERQQKVKEALYLYLLEKKEENDLSKTFTAYNTRVITPPMGPIKPVAPRGLKSIMFGLIFAISLPTGLIFIRFNIDNMVRSRADLDARVKAPFLGNIPLNGKRPSYFKRMLLRKGEVDQASEIVVRHGNGSAINEAFRMVRSNLELMNSRLVSDKVEKNVVTMVTSAIPGSGKTFVSLNLAAAYALKKIKVVLVDVDLRKATLSKTFGSPQRGVTSYLAGKTTFDDIIINKASGMEYFDFVPAGIIPPDPAELIDSPQFARLIADLKLRYDVVILDCPPTEPVTDSSVITRYVDRTVYVVRVGNLKRDFLDILQEYYEDKLYTNLTVVLNAVEMGSATSAYGYGYGYGYGNSKD